MSIPPPGDHGDDAGRIARALGRHPSELLDLATSMNPVAPDIRLLVATSLDSLRTYPDPDVATGALATAMGVDRGHLLLTNGGAEAIALVAAELPVGRIDEPDFGLYRRHLTEVRPDAPRWRSNPHNPTGLLAAPDDAADVWDEAFYALATGTWTRGDAATGSIVVGSLTKLFACPGLRLGYVLCGDGALRERLARRQPRWAVSGPAAAALPKLLDIADLAGWQRRVEALRRDLVAVLETAGLTAEPSDANFVLVREAASWRERLARLGIVVRGCSSFGLPDAIRLAVPGEEGLQRLSAALRLAAPGSPGAARTSPPATRPVKAEPAPPPSPGRRHSIGAVSGALLVTGTSSDAGKSQLVAGLCRLLAREGVRVAPFKAQNMSLNSFATASGHEIGRAQGVQALAAGIDPEVAMNPVLLKPTGRARSQVVVMGEPLAEMSARDYQETRRASLLPVVLDALADLRRRHDIVICEGAGSPAEINLLAGDITNLGLAEAAGMPAVLVGDIERGGVFASIAGTFAVLPERLSRHLKAFAINKFRGDPTLLTPGIEALEKMTGTPCAGVVPYLDDLHLDAEDSLGLSAVIAAGKRTSAAIDVAVIALPRLSNFTDLDALAIEPGVSLRLVESAATLGDPDLVLLPGSKSTVADLAWLRSTGLADAIGAAAAEPGGPTILGICAGFQMLGASIVDEYESKAGRVEALGLLPVVTTFTPEKRTRPRRGSSLTHEVKGYEIRQGDPVWIGHGSPRPLIDLDDDLGSGGEGAVSEDGRIAGTSLHGLFESDAFRAAFVAEVAGRRHKTFASSGVSFAARREDQLDRLADACEEHLDIGLLMSIAATASKVPA